MREVKWLIFIVAEQVSSRPWTRTRALFCVCVCYQAILTLAYAQGKHWTTSRSRWHWFLPTWMLVMSTLNNSLKFFPVFLPIFHLALLTLWNLPHLRAREWNWTLRKKIVSGYNFINSFINIYSFWLGDSIRANFKKVSLAVNFFMRINIFKKLAKSKTPVH